jgi:hypothetical protein
MVDSSDRTILRTLNSSLQNSSRPTNVDPDVSRSDIRRCPRVFSLNAMSVSSTYQIVRQAILDFLDPKAARCDNSDIAPSKR